MKVKNFAKKLVGKYDIDVVFDSDPEAGTISGEKCCNYCVTEKYGDEKISQILIDDNGDITLILESAKIYIKEVDLDDEGCDYDKEFYGDDE